MLLLIRLNLAFVPVVGYSGAGFIAEFGCLRRVLGMAKHTNYAYCSKRHKPLRAHDCRVTSIAGQWKTHSCKVCSSNERGFDCIASVPGNLLTPVEL